MNTASIQLDVVSVEKSIFSGKVQHIQVTGSEGEMGIKAGHAPLITSIKPGMVHIVKEDNTDAYIYISGGMLEIQPSNVSVLADVAARAEDLDEQAALSAKKQAEEKLSNKGQDFDHNAASQELIQAVAQLQLIKKLKRK
tara:strand:+ start:10518 stop:10937 length:420 start_codon:yes stop_codon:yes gene_type:complete